MLNYKSILNEQNFEKEKQIILGGSFSFGVGVTRDENSISSLINKNNLVSLNYSGRAYTGYQEIISLFSNINNIKS